MNVTFGPISFPVPSEFIDCFDFALKLMTCAPHAYHFRENEVDVRRNWKDGDLDRIGRNLSSYKAFYKYAIEKHVRGKYVDLIATRLAEIYVKNDKHWDEVTRIITSIVLRNEALLKAKSSTPEIFREIATLLEVARAAGTPHQLDDLVADPEKLEEFIEAMLTR